MGTTMSTTMRTKCAWCSAKQPYGEATPYYGVQAVWAQTRLRCPKRAIGVNAPSGNTFFQAPSRGTHKTVVESL